MAVRVRFAPSPTGALHLGGLRTALYNFLTARKLGGTFTLRIEDTDQTRLVPGSVDDIINGLRWAGVDFDHGPTIGGPHGPYHQSERLDLYRDYARRLIESGSAYRCFCRPEALAATRERLFKLRSNATYDKACLHLSEEDVARRVRAGEKHVIRLNDSVVPRQQSPVKDIVFGSLQDGHGSLPTDPILLKSDLFPTYHLASVVDDHEMEITHVIRGEEWLQSLPLHVDLYAALGLKPPQFAHLPLLLNPDGSKMSKRKGDVQVADYIKRGWEPEAVTNWLALAGWGVGQGADAKDSHPLLAVGALSRDEMIELFDLSALTHRRTILDPGKLVSLNKHHLKQKLEGPADGVFDRLLGRAEGIFQEAYPSSSQLQPEYIAQVAKALVPRINTLDDMQEPALSAHFFQEPDMHSDAAVKLKATVGTDTYIAVIGAVRQMLQIWTPPDLPPRPTAEDFHRKLQMLRDTELEGLTTKEVMNSLRHALTGSKVGPSVVEIMGILGHATCLMRLERAHRAAQL